jgi:hypothetical protein
MDGPQWRRNENGRFSALERHGWAVLHDLTLPAAAPTLLTW